MLKRDSVKVIIPVLNEEASISKVIKDIPAFVEEIIVVDNGSTDNTAKVAKDFGATVLQEINKGYGNACLKGIDYLQLNSFEGIVVFLDGDYSDFPQEIEVLIAPIESRTHEFVIGSRVLGEREKGSLTPVQVFGNWLSTFLISWFFRAKFTDLGPFRAIRFEELLALEMQDKTFGWTVEMQVKIAKRKTRFLEIPVSYRNRIGKSKVSGTVKGSVLAGYKILFTIFKSLF